MTVYYGLKTLANLRSGDRVLIHSAAGGVGQAAVQLAQRVGAEIFATASRGKWEFLKSQGIDHVMDSRSLEYIKEIKNITDGEGVDVILNSFAGEFVIKNLEVLKPGGRYVELGKLGILSQEDMDELLPTATYLPFDLFEVALENKQAIRNVLTQIQADIQAGLIKPIIFETFPIQNAVDAFRHMAMAKHIGKVVLTIPKDELSGTNNADDSSELTIPEQPRERILDTPVHIQPDATYLITGGLGDLGLQVAYWIVMAGARYLILTGRSGKGNSETQRAVALLEQSGAKVRIVKADISRQEDVSRLFADINPGFPPIKGIVHAAGVTADATLLDETWEHFESVLAPKVRGLWNLHIQSQSLELDFFITFSSIASMIGAPGLGNYASANAFMDGLMQDRYRKGIPGLSINWGPWAEIGMNVRMEKRHLANQAALGLIPLLPILGLQALETTFELDLAQVAVMRMDWNRFVQILPVANQVPLLETFSQRKITGSGMHAELLAELKAAPANDRKKIMLGHLRTELARVLGLESIQQIELKHRLLDFGLDSLMAIELINSLNISLGVNLPATMVFNYPTIGAVIDFIVDEVLELGSDSGSDSSGDIDREELNSSITATTQLVTNPGRSNGIDIEAISNE
jgi:NAD(P)-dependent dehydrogenase (short-subunit alcohol dehydrogenase family)/acyl carrier protein/uncharacterized membrane protein (DUF2068 family)